MVKPQRSNFSLHQRPPSYKPYFNQQAVEDLKLDTKLYTREEMEQSFDSGKEDTDGNYEEGFDFPISHSTTLLPTLIPTCSEIKFGSPSSSPTKTESQIKAIPAPQGRRVEHEPELKGRLRIPSYHLRKYHNKKNSRMAVDKESESIEHNKTQDEKPFHFNFSFERLEEHKRIALKDFCSTVKNIESNLKQPLDVYLKVNQGKGFIGTYSGCGTSHTNNHTGKLFMEERMMDRDDDERLYFGSMRYGNRPILPSLYSATRMEMIEENRNNDHFRSRGYLQRESLSRHSFPVLEEDSPLDLSYDDEEMVREYFIKKFE